VYRVSDELALVLTLDFFPPIVDDPFDYGAIAVANAVSDVYALGGRPFAGLNIAGFPDDLPKEVIARIFEGGATKAAEAGVSVVGGHTVRDEEPKYGMAVTGFVEPGKQVAINTARPGDSLVLTKPLGTGAITTAGKAQTVTPDVLAGAVTMMSILNRDAAHAMLATGVSAATDVTGFGLLGHLKAMTASSGVGARVRRSSLPVLPGAVDLIEAGAVPGGTYRNIDSLGDTVSWDPSLTQADRLLLADPQTSGGLLIAVPKARLRELLDRLRDAGTPSAEVVGEIVEDESGVIQALP
jgi:selenide,water dikinase